jgi:hypothetical protein
MKQKTIYLLCLILFTISFSSCEDFIEKDLSKKSLTILSPADNNISPNFTQTFWWEEIKGANKYEIQIVKPSFSSIQEFITDTLVSGSKLSYNLLPGTYQWRIRAKNSSSATEFITRTLTIDSTLDLAGQSLVLLSPSDNYYTKNLTNTFTWQIMPNAQYYIIQILESGSIIHTQSCTTTSASYSFPNEANYQWRVFAQNSTSNSGYYTRTITVDTTRPNVPIVAFPLTDTTTAQPIQLGWTCLESNLNCRLQIALDSTFSAIIKDTVLSENSYNFYNPVTGQFYYWKVKAIDKALNESAYFYRRRIKRN